MRHWLLHHSRRLSPHRRGLASLALRRDFNWVFSDPVRRKLATTTTRSLGDEACFAGSVSNCTTGLQSVAKWPNHQDERQLYACLTRFVVLPHCIRDCVLCFFGSRHQPGKCLVTCSYGRACEDCPFSPLGRRSVQQVKSFGITCDPCSFGVSPTGKALIYCWLFSVSSASILSIMRCIAFAASSITPI